MAYFSVDKYTMHIQTIHSLAFRYLSEQRYKLNVQNEQQQKYRIRQIIKRLDLSEEVLDPYLQEFTNCVNRMVPIEQYRPSNLDTQQFWKISQLYQEQKQAEGFMDFDDLLLFMYDHLSTIGVSGGSYIMVDEFQDTSLLQYEILKLLAAPTNNLFAVGDDDQSIYSWRGACNAPLQFVSDFPHAKRLHLTTNYRSTKQIVSVSSALIAGNETRLLKEFVAHPGSNKGSKPLFISPQDEMDEVKWVVETIESAYRENISWSDMSVIYRLNNQAFLIQHELAKKDIPFRILGGEPKVLNHWVAQGLTGYLSTAVHPNDVESFFYILTRPSRFINKRIIDYANMIVLQLGLLPLEALRSQQLSDASIKALNQLESNLTQITKMSAQDALYHIWVKMGFGTYARETASAFKLDYEECQQIFDTVCCLPNPGESVEGFVGRLSVLKNVAANTRESNVVTLTTCHSAKGLEFPLVILVGAVEGTLPYAKSLGGDDLRGLEEERRLAYVATTRSKDRLLISSPQTMRGRTVQPSRFVSEIRAGILPEEIIEGNSFDHPVWGRCIWGAKTEDIVTIIKPDGEVKRTTIAWLTEKGVL